MPTEKPKRSDNVTSDAEREHLQNQIARPTFGNDKPDEGLRPDQLTSEKDGV